MTHSWRRTPVMSHSLRRVCPARAGALAGGVLNESFRSWEVLNDSFKTFAGAATPTGTGPTGPTGRTGLSSRAPGAGAKRRPQRRRPLRVLRPPDAAVAGEPRDAAG